MNASERHNVTVTGRPDGQAMVFAHGFGCDQNMWRFVAPAFEDDFRVIVFDYAGAGDADPTAYDAERHSSLDGYAADVMEICLGNEPALMKVGEHQSARCYLHGDEADPERMDSAFSGTEGGRAR